VTVATRYTHTAFETIHPGDLEATAALLRLLVTNPLPARRA
jgi:endoglucanase